MGRAPGAQVGVPREHAKMGPVGGQGAEAAEQHRARQDRDQADDVIPQTHLAGALGQIEQTGGKGRI